MRYFGLTLGIVMMVSIGRAADTDLDFVYKPIPEADNGFPLLQQAIKLRKKTTHAPAHPSKGTGKKPKKDPDQDMTDFFGGSGNSNAAGETENQVYDRLTSLDAWRSGTITAKDREFARRLIKRNAPALRLVEQAIARKRIQAPEIKSFEQLLPYLSPLRDFARMQSIQARLLAEDGKLEAACEQLMTTIEFGHKLKYSESCLITYLVGLAIKSIGEKTFADLLGRPGISSKKLVGYAKCLEAYRDDRDALVTVLKIERKIALLTVDELVSIQVFSVTGKKEAELPGFFDKQRTQTLFDDAYRGLIADVAKPVLTADDGRWRKDHVITILMTFNALGEVAKGMLIPILSRADEKCRRGRLGLEVLRLNLVLKAYRQDTGALPKTLKELVDNGYFTVVPDDPFSNGTLQYSVDRRIIWSAGNNGALEGPTTDDAIAKRTGGPLSHRAFREKDPTFTLFFGGKNRN